MSTIERVRLIEEIAVELARHRLGDDQKLLKSDEIVGEEDRRLALRLVRMAAPLTQNRRW